MGKSRLHTSILLVIAAAMMGVGIPATSSQPSAATTTRESERLAVRLYTQASITVKFKDKGIEQSKDLSDAVHSGSAFALAANGKTYLVTVAHPMLFDEPYAKALFVNAKSPGEFVSFQKADVRIRISSLAFKPIRFLIDSDNDIAAMEMQPEFWETTHLVPLIPADPAKLGVGHTIQILGYPETSTMDIKELKLSDANSAKLTLNAEIPSGFSGGPAVDSDNNRVIGLIARSTKKQGFCIPIDTVLNVLRRFPTDSVECSGTVTFPIPPKP